MSQADPEAINLEVVPENGEEIDTGHGILPFLSLSCIPVISPCFWTGGSGYPPQPGQDQPSQGASSAVDGSEPLFSMYVDMTAEHDNKMAKSWKGDADGILVFVSPDTTTLGSSCVNFQCPRLVCSLLLLQLWPQYPSRTSGRTPRIFLPFTPPTSISSSLMPMDLMFPFPPLSRIH